MSEQPYLSDAAVGRLLTWLPRAESSAPSTASHRTAGGVWAVSGGRVCVIGPHILLTAAHICYKDSELLRLRVLHTADDCSVFADTPIALSHRALTLVIVRL